MSSNGWDPTSRQNPIATFLILSSSSILSNVEVSIYFAFFAPINPKPLTIRSPTIQPRKPDESPAKSQ